MKRGNAVLALLLALASTHYASAVTFQFVAQFSENCTLGSVEDVEESHDAILEPFFESTKSEGYQMVEPGGSVAPTTPAEDAAVTGGTDGEGSVRRLQVDCPSKCQKSNSATCRSLGCAKCGEDCARRLWQSVPSSKYRYWSRSRAGGVASLINPQFSKFARSQSCRVWLTIYQINADGSTTLLT